MTTSLPNMVFCALVSRISFTESNAYS